MNYELQIISYLCTKFNGFMKKLTPFIGILLIILGTLALVATRFSTLSTHNSLLFVGLLCIIAGIIMHIRSIKQDSRF